jgi:hypothetical protein
MGSLGIAMLATLRLIALRLRGHSWQAAGLPCGDATPREE